MLFNRITKHIKFTIFWYNLHEISLVSFRVVIIETRLISFSSLSLVKNRIMNWYCTLILSIQKADYLSACICNWSTALPPKSRNLHDAWHAGFKLLRFFIDGSPAALLKPMGTRLVYFILFCFISFFVVATSYNKQNMFDENEQIWTAE